MIESKGNNSTNEINFKLSSYFIPQIKVSIIHFVLFI